METFRDKTGKEWTIDVHLGTIERCREEIGVNILEWGMEREGDEPTETLLFRLRGDPVLVGNIVWSLARAKDDTDADRDVFMAALNGDAVWNARVAFESDVINFTHGPEQEHLIYVRQTLGKMFDEILAARTRVMRDPRLNQALNNALHKLKGTFGDLLDSLDAPHTTTPTDN